MAKKSCSSSTPTTGEELQARDRSEFKFRGVRKRKWGKWVSEIRLPHSRDRIWLGSYDSAEKAARAFDAAQFCLRGRAGNFNFPDNPPEIAGGKGMTSAEIQVAAARFANATTYEGTTTTTEETVAYSPSISDGSTVQMESEASGVEESFHAQLRLAETELGSGNYAFEFGPLPGFDEWNCGNFYSPLPQQSYFDYGVSWEDFYDASIYQDSSLWNF
uniref:AP2/ERF domain-containing protein n=2 Tax=Opuntia streptacantha TaxID=393608 RepID=A0A7C9CTL3_OPUST